MYAGISIHRTNDRFEEKVHWCELHPMEAPETRPEEIKKRRDAVMQVMNNTRAKLSADDRNRVYLAMSDLVKVLPAAFADLDFAIYLGIAHFCLPTEQRKAREDRIEAIVTSYFGPRPSRHAELQKPLAVLQAQLPLLPDEKLEALASTHCAFLMLMTCLEIGHPACGSDAHALYAMFMKVLLPLKLGQERTMALNYKLSEMYASFPAEQRLAFLDFVAHPKNANACTHLQRVQTLVDAKARSPSMLSLNRTVLSILKDVTACSAALSDAELEELAAPSIELQRSQESRILTRLRIASVNAVQAGVPLGKWGASIADAILKIKFAKVEMNARMAAKRRIQDKAATTTPAATHGATDMDPVHAWSVTRLVRWIEGPLAERSKKGRLDRKAVVAQEKVLIEQEMKDKKTAGLKPGVMPTAITEDEVGQVMQEGLAATAGFFHDDIQDMALVAKALGTEAGVLDACLGLQTQLKELCAAPASVDEEKARTLLQNAEACMVALRNSIKTAEASALLVKRLDTRLIAALNAESLVLGKRHGGVIACPLHAGDWPWVAQRYHRRWLPQVTHLVIDGEDMQLASDQAVGLYVTGSSQSNFAFDVSVHLWQRRAGGTSLPGEGDALYPAMNTTEWFDTYISCAVLHVPQAVN